MYDVKQASSAYPLLFLMVDSTDHRTGKTGLIGSLVVQVRKVGGSFATPAGAVTEVGFGWYQVAGNATDTAVLGPLLLHAEATGADQFDACFPVVAHDPQDPHGMGLTYLDEPISRVVVDVFARTVGKKTFDLLCHVLGAALGGDEKITENNDGTKTISFADFGDPNNERVSSLVGRLSRVVTLAPAIVSGDGATKHGAIFPAQSPSTTLQFSFQGGPLRAVDGTIIQGNSTGLQTLPDNATVYVWVDSSGNLQTDAPI